jgi:hypothetical protein
MIVTGKPGASRVPGMLRALSLGLTLSALSVAVLWHFHFTAFLWHAVGPRGPLIFGAIEMFAYTASLISFLVCLVFNRDALSHVDLAFMGCINALIAWWFLVGLGFCVLLLLGWKT